MKKTIKNPKTDNYDGEFHEFDEDEVMGVREVTVNDSRFVVKQKNPFALWEIGTMSGPLPKDLEGLYTSISIAEAAIERYINKRDGVTVNA